MITANRRAKATIGPMKHCTDTERNTPTGGELARELSGLGRVRLRRAALPPSPSPSSAAR